MARSNKHHDSNREALIQIALDLFLENGYENTTITQIMKAANLSKGGMYHYFPSKEEILNAVIQFGLTQEIEKLKATVDALPLEEKLFGFTRSVDIGKFTRKLLSYTNNNKDSFVAYRVREYNIHLLIPVLTEILQQGIAGGIYNTSYPKEIAEFCVLLVKAIVDTNLLPPTNKEGQLRRVEAFMQFAYACLEPTPAYMEQFKQILKSDLDLQ